METKEQTPMIFNMSMLTLERINNLIKDSTDYRVQGNPLGIRANVLELYKEVRPYLLDSKKCKKDPCKDKDPECEMHWGDKLRSDISKHEMSFDSVGRVLNFESQMITDLDQFDDWIRIKLNEKGLLMKAGEDERSMFS